jgi:serine/threonine protein kinase
MMGLGGDSPGEDGDENGKASDPHPHLNATRRFNTILQETSHVTSDKVALDEKELERLPNLGALYELGDSFAEGGQGVLRTGRDKFLKRFVAVKDLKEKFLENKQVVANFVAEAKITSQLDHPAIIPLYGMLADKEKGGLSIAMKLIHGRTLREVLDDHLLTCKRHRKNPAFLRSIISRSLKDHLEDFVKACDAVAFAHERGVVHRDLKPDNIMVGDHHEVYVMDWGVACLDAGAEERGGVILHPVDDSEIERRSTISGTPGFIAPEVVVGKPPSHLSDQYSLGVILFEIATLKSPVIGVTVEEVFENTRDGNIATLTHAIRKCNMCGDLKAIIRKAMAVEPKDRYPTVEDLANDIRRFLTNEETVARPDNIQRKVMRWMVNHRNKAIAIFLLILLSLAGLAINNLMERNKAIAESKQRALRQVALHSSIEREAHYIDSHMLHVEGILARFADKISAALSGLTQPEKGHANIFRTADFKLKNPPPGTLYAPAYRQKVSLKTANYKLAPGLALDNAIPALDAISPTVPTMFAYLAESQFLLNEEPSKQTSELKRMARGKGFPVMWVYFGTADGLLVSYPGSGGVADGYDPRKRPWYGAAAKIKAIRWSSPYVDAFGLGLIVSASKSVWKGDQLLGVASVDMTFHHVQTMMSRMGASRPSVRGAYLVNGDGEVVLSSHVEKRSLKEARKTLGKVEFKPFPYSQLLEKIKKRPSGQFEVNDNGKTLLVGYAPVPTLGCYFVEVVDFDIYMARPE